MRKTPQPAVNRSMRFTRVNSGRIAIAPGEEERVLLQEIEFSGEWPQNSDATGSISRPKPASYDSPAASHGVKTTQGPDIFADKRGKCLTGSLKPVNHRG